MTALLGILVMLALLAAGIPVAFAMGISGAVGLYLIGGLEMIEGFLRTSPVSAVASQELATVPMFLLMAELVVISRIADDLFDSAKVWVGRMPGGLAISTAVAGAGFGAISGSSTASAATLAGTSIPAMRRHGYELKFAGGVVAISGTLAILIPPSIGLVIYALVADVSVAKVLIAGVIPGILVALTIILTVLVLAALWPSSVPRGQHYTLREKIQTLRVVGPMIALILLVTGAIYLGIATPTEAASLGAFGSLIICIMRRRLSFKSLTDACFRAARTSCMIMLIIVTAHIFGFFFTLTGLTQALVSFVGDLETSRWVILTLILLMYLVLGCFMDQLAILFLTVPIVLPVVTSLGFDPIWFGVIFMLTAEVGLVTPPVGLNVFVVARYAQLPVMDVFVGVTPHVIAHLLIIAILVAFPQITLWLPSML